MTQRLHVQTSDFLAATWNYWQLGCKSWTWPTFATSQRLVAASTQMCDLYARVNDALKYQKNLVTILLWKVSIVWYEYLCHTYIIILEILDKLKKFFERNVRNILEILTTNFWNILIMILEANWGIGTEEKIRIDFKGKFRNNFLERV